MQDLYFIDMIYNRARPWGHYNPLPLFLHCPRCNFTLHLQAFQNFQKDVGTLPA
jgi:hypothetical protein